ncbi:MAG: transglutaminase domain-containing protein [Candidatus Latescibacterota bacterium]
MGTKVVEVRFSHGYWDVYCQPAEVMIQSFEELPGDALGTRVTLCSIEESFSHFLCSLDDGDFQNSHDGSFLVPFAPSGELQQSTVRVQAVFENPSKVREITLQFFYRPSFYEASRRKDYPHTVIVTSDPILSSFPEAVPPEDWVFSKPTAQEKAYASEKWGDLLEGATTDHEKATVLAKAIIPDLRPHAGAPSEAMKDLSPFEQYERMVSGKDRGFCTHFTNVFVCACNCLGIPTRRIHIEEMHSFSDTCTVQLESMHATTEIYDRRLNQWIWMDLLSDTLGAYLGEEGPLTLAEFHLFINQPARRKRLKLLLYDMETDSEKLLPLEECPPAFSFYEGCGTEFHYTKVA